MSEKERFEQLFNEYKTIEKEYTNADEFIIDFEGTKDHERYMGYKGDNVRKKMFPEVYENYKKKEELEDEYKEFKETVISEATRLNSEIDKDIQDLENKIKVNEKYLEVEKEKIANINKQLDDIKNTEEYRNNDEETLIKYDHLMGDLANSEIKKNTLEDRISTIKDELKTTKLDKEDFEKKYSDYIEDTGVEKTDEEPVAEEPVAEEKTDEEPVTEEPVTEEKNKKTRKGNRVNNVSVSSLENNASKEENKEDLKETFKLLCNKAKKGKLEDKEFNELVDIMKNKENYEKLNITTGLFFNKSRGIFKSLEKFANGDKEKQDIIGEAYQVYEGIFFEKHSEKKIKMLSKFFAIDEVEMRERVEFLPEHTDIKPGITDTLATEVIPVDETKAEEYVDLSSFSTTSKEKNVKDKEIY